MQVSAVPAESPSIQDQATVNIGTIGHVAHGKSTVVKALSGTKTIKFKLENIKNSTIKLGYANAKIFECPDCEPPGSYSAHSSDTREARCAHCQSTAVLRKHVSFIDCPGHDSLMTTMLNGTAVMDAALLLVASNEPCPQPQTLEHLAAIEISSVDNIMVLQNKVDLVKKKDALAQYDDIKKFVEGTRASGAPIIPISAQLGLNLDCLCEYLCKKIPEPERDTDSAPCLTIIRSFDVNKPGCLASALKGGVAGGSLARGVLKVGDRIEIRPGLILREDGRVVCKPIFSKIVSLQAEKNTLSVAGPGGLIAIGTEIDPFLTRGNRLVGQVLGRAGELPPVYSHLDVKFYLLKRLVSKNEEKDEDGAASRITKIKQGETLMLSIGSMQCKGEVQSVEKKTCRVVLVSPVCTQINEKIALSRNIHGSWRLIGWGKLVGGTEREN